MFDLHVVGAGPAGSFAALTALRDGKNVLLSEEHAQVGEPVHCSGLVSASGLAQLSDVVDFRAITLNTIRRANLHGKDKRLTLSYPAPKAHVIDRGAFDRLAAQKFADQGGKLRVGHPVRALADLQSHHVVGADGPISTVARLFSFPALAPYASSWQGDFAYCAPDLSAVDVFFNPEWAPGFIGWIIPIDEERAKIGLGVGRAGALPEAKKRMLSNLRLSSARPLSEFSALIPLNARAQTGKTVHSAGHDYSVCLAGDAAGQVKATSGGGIFFGASCGRIAGAHAPAPARYERRWREKFGADLALHRALRNTLDALPPPALDGWLSILQALRADLLLTEAGEMDEFSKMMSMRTLSAYAKTWLMPNSAGR